jgi:lipopolysaccharide biosynthesis glycosyltransferase
MPLAVSMKSVIEKNAEDFKNIVFNIIETDIKPETKNKLRETAKPHECKFYNGSHIDKVFNPKIVDEEMIKPAYSRLLVGELLDKKVEKCIMLDADTICLGSLKSVYEEDIKDCIIAGVNSSGVSKKHKDLHHMPVNEPYINIGFLLINLTRWREENTFDKLKEVSENYPLVMRLEEMDLINITIKEKKVIPLNYNVTNKEFLKTKSLAFFYKGYWPYGEKDYYSIEEIEDAKKNIIIYHYGGYNPLSPLAGYKKNRFYKTFTDYRSQTPYKDVMTIKDKRAAGKKARRIAIAKNFCFNHLPFPVLRLVYRIFHSTQKSHGTV